MVNMYGAGNAYDRRYIQKNTFMPQHIKTRTPSAPQHTVLCSGNHGGDTTVNYKVQIGPGGFWGGALGFLNGFLNTAPNLFGNKTNWNSAGTINQPQMNPAQDKLGNLKTLFPKFKIVSEGNAGNEEEVGREERKAGEEEGRKEGHGCVSCPGNLQWPGEPVSEWLLRGRLQRSEQHGRI